MIILWKKNRTVITVNPSDSSKKIEQNGIL